MPESRLSRATREEIFRRAAGCCEYCCSQERFSPDSFSVEHITPRARGGGGDLENLALACQGCNNRKYVEVAGIDPVSGLSASLYHPRLQLWNDHFAWSADGAAIVGLTPTGRATVEKLELNRPSLVALRRILFDAGEHPPE
jgi:hypothetical protein